MAETLRAPKPDLEHKFGEIGLEVVGPVDLDRWVTIGRKIGIFDGAINWAIGDWLSLGDQLFRTDDRGAALYERALELTGRTLENLSRCRLVAEAFTAEQRVRGVAWSLHYEALRLPEASRAPALERARDHAWSRARFRTELVVRGSAHRPIGRDVEPSADAAADPEDEDPRPLVATAAPARLTRVTGPDGSLAWRRLSNILARLRCKACDGPMRPTRPTGPDDGLPGAFCDPCGRAFIPTVDWLEAMAALGR